MTARRSLRGGGVGHQRLARCQRDLTGLGQLADPRKQQKGLFIEPNPARAGAGRITFGVAGLDVLLERLAAQRIEHEPIETYSNGVRHVVVADPDGNTIALAEPSDAASASPRSTRTGASS